MQIYTHCSRILVEQHDGRIKTGRRCCLRGSFEESWFVLVAAATPATDIHRHSHRHILRKWRLWLSAQLGFKQFLASFISSAYFIFNSRFIWNMGRSPGMLLFVSVWICYWLCLLIPSFSSLIEIEAAFRSVITELPLPRKRFELTIVFPIPGPFEPVNSRFFDHNMRKKACMPEFRQNLTTPG